MYEHIRQIRHRRPVQELSYIRDLHDGGLSLERFREGQLQFRHAVEQFSVAMQQLRDRVHDPAVVSMLEANLHDERGGGDPEQSHGSTFRRFLRGLGLEDDRIESAPEGPAVAAFNASVLDACREGSPTQALAMLGMIEDLFAEISDRIGRGVIARGWATPSTLVHYATHETLDVAHAAAFYVPLESRWSTERARIERGLDEGWTAMTELYDAL